MLKIDTKVCSNKTTDFWMDLFAFWGIFIFVTALQSRADVIFNQTIGEKVASSNIIAVATFESVEGTAPYTNSNPPIAKFRVSKALRGCKIDQILSLPDFNVVPKPRGHRKSPMPPVPPTEKELRDWAEAPIIFPEKGTEYLLLLGQAKEKLMDGHIPYPDYIASPDKKLIEQIEGMLIFSIELKPEEDRKINSGSPIPISLTITNNSKAKVKFALSSLALTTSIPGGESISKMPPNSNEPQVVEIEPSKSKILNIDMAKLYTGIFDKPGDYWFQLDIPAQGGEMVMRHIEIVEKSLAYACSRASHILRVKVKLDNNTATLDDPVYLRLRGEMLPGKIEWTNKAESPNGERRILCLEGNLITYDAPDNHEILEQLENLLANDPIEWWSHAEDSDERFQIPDRTDIPESVQKQALLKSRLKELP